MYLFSCTHDWLERNEVQAETLEVLWTSTVASYLDSFGFVHGRVGIVLKHDLNMTLGCVGMCAGIDL